MNNCCTEMLPDLVDSSRGAWVPRRLPDPANLPKPRWREALLALAGPALRTHRYRNLQARALQQVLNSLDGCKAGSE